MPIPRAWKIFEDDGEIADEQVELELLWLGREVMDAACRFVQTGHCDYADY